MEHVAYILASKKTKKLYKGHTSNLLERFKSHNHLSKKGWTVRFRPWRVVFVRFFNTKKEAMDFEKYLKTGTGREWIQKNIDLECLVGPLSAAADTGSSAVFNTSKVKDFA